jgi:hypothetical protein
MVPVMALIEFTASPVDACMAETCAEISSVALAVWLASAFMSLGSPCRFRFRKATGGTWQRHTLAAAPRSLYLISGESRTVWEHSIPGVEAPRTSITFRTMVDRTA